MAATTIEKPQTASTVPERVDEAVRYTPLVDILETNDGFTFYADVPGAKAGDLDITYEDDTLTIEAKVQPRQPQDQEYLVKEYGVGNFSRKFIINAPINSEGIRAELKNGELKLFVPKSEAAKTKKIPITAQ